MAPSIHSDTCSAPRQRPGRSSRLASSAALLFAALTGACSLPPAAPQLAEGGAPPAGALCAATQQQPGPPRAQALAAAALREHHDWGAQTLDAQGRLLRAGASEAGDGPAFAPWRRVLQYWAAVDPEDQRLPKQVRYGALRPADRTLLEQQLAQGASARLQSLGLGPDQGLPPEALQAASVALARVAVVDTPWSAAFISWLARDAGLDAQAFAFSSAHADYAAAAWSATQAEAVGMPSAQALRACDLLQTPPRVGDLVCHARGRSAGLGAYDALTEALHDRLATGRALPMHCDVVTQVDAQGFEAVGGNVLDAVTLRRLDFAPGTQRVDSSYLPEVCTAQALAAGSCTNRHMSRQPWSLLLQWR